ncbi:tRNA (adenine(37)-N6)-methyltransferase [Rhinophrynus dorsalis]
MTCSLEAGSILTTPIGYIESCFTAKNGTPRQPSVCSLSRGCLRISKSVFNNPEHSLMGLEQFSHVWILFVFHKNGRLSCKAKVQPPRLNGAKTGVFSTRSPHRPNAIGLTLAKLEKVEGGTLYLSGIDMIQGTPVLDIKPYISEYDSPQPTISFIQEQQENETQYSGEDNPNSAKPERNNKIEMEQTRPVRDLSESSFNSDKEISTDMSKTPVVHAELNEKEEQTMALMKNDVPSPVLEDQCTLQGGALSQPEDDVTIEGQRSKFTRPGVTSTKEAKDRYSSGDSFVPTWVRDAPVASLKVRFTPHSENELRLFKAPCESGEPSFHYFQSPEEAKCAITTVLCADPRSVYRRKQCQDRLFYFSLDTMHITCWFGDGFTEVLRIQPHKGDAIDNS